MSCDDNNTCEGVRLFESGAVTIAPGNEATIIEAVGEFSSADVWFAMPTTWQEGVALRLYARLGAMRVLLCTVALGDAGGVVDGSNVSGIAASCRGRPCTGFIVTLECEGEPLFGGQFAVRAWSGAEAPEVLGAQPSDEDWIKGPIKAEPSIALVAGQFTDTGLPSERFRMLRVDDSGKLEVTTSQIVTVEPDGGTFSVEGTGTSGSPAGGVLTVQGPAAGTLSVAAAGLGTAGSPSGGVLTVQGPASGVLSVSAAGVGTAGSPSGGVLTVQGPASGVLSVSAAGLGTAGSPSGGVLTVQGPAAGTLSVAAAGVGTAGTPSGGVLTVQGPGSGGVITVTGDSSGALNVKGSRTPAGDMSNPTGCVDVGAFLFGWDGSNWDRVKVATPADAMANPADCLAAANFMLGWDGSNWNRVRVQAVSGTSAVTDASAPASLPTVGFGYGYDTVNSRWARIRCDANGVALVLPQGPTALADNVNVSGNSLPQAWSFLAHRNQAGNWYSSRGGYNGVIAAASLPAVMNVLDAGAYNTTAPAPSNGDASALQVDSRGSLVVVQGKPSNDARDTPSLIDFNGVDKGIIKASAGNLLSLELTNNHSAVVWLHIFNKATNPANGDTPIWRTLVQIKGIHQLSRSMLSEAGIRLTTGISWAISTSRATLTLVTGTPDVAVNATYV